MKYCSIFIFISLFSCSTNGKIELEIVSNQVFFSKVEHGRIKNIIEYKITNNTNENYYFNSYSTSKLLWKIKGIQPSNVIFQFLDEKGNPPEFSQKENYPTMEYAIYEKIKYEIEKNDVMALNYSIPPEYMNFMDKNNFYLNSGETKYFEILYYFPNSNHSIVKLNSNKIYNFQILIYSDSTNKNEILTRSALKTIKTNNLKIYHGIIKSKNKVPIKYVD